MLSLKTLSASLVGLALLAAPAGAVSLAPNSPAVLLTPGFPATGYQATPSAIAMGLFTQDYTFIVPTALDAQLSSLFPHAPSGGTLTPPAIGDLTATWYLLNTGTLALTALGSSTTSTDPTGVYIPANASLLTHLSALGAGFEYVLRITGNSAGGDSRYDFDLHAVKSTPLPGAVFLFGSVLAGGVGGMKLYRRRRQTA